jgi:hypothetical protein
MKGSPSVSGHRTARDEKVLTEKALMKRAGLFPLINLEFASGLFRFLTAAVRRGGAREKA